MKLLQRTYRIDSVFSFHSSRHADTNNEEWGGKDTKGKEEPGTVSRVHNRIHPFWLLLFIQLALIKSPMFPTLESWKPVDIMENKYSSSGELVYCQSADEWIAVAGYRVSLRSVSLDEIDWINAKHNTEPTIRCSIETDKSFSARSIMLRSSERTISKPFGKRGLCLGKSGPGRIKKILREAIVTTKQIS
jgi:hypothetical protein